MAQISGSVSDKIYPLKVFLGLNENPDGDTKLKMGEASACRNWKITRDRNLQRRPGIKTVYDFGESTPSKNVKGLWTGYVGGTLYMLAAHDSKLRLIYDGSNGTFPGTNLGYINTSGPVHFFGFDSKVYILANGYKVWNGTTLSNVSDDAYIPIVRIGIGPDGTDAAGGEPLEQINKLTLRRKAWLSPDGINSVFTLPEFPIYSVIRIRKLSNNTTVSPENYSVDTETGKITFLNGAPAAAANAFAVDYKMPDTASLLPQVTSMRYSELFGGPTDSRVFLYGDGSNQIFYSDMDYDGNPRADYFPDLNVINVGDANTPVTGVIRHFSKLNVYKIDSTWTVSSSSITLADGTVTAAFYCSSVNKTIGNVAPGQVRLVMNSPRTLAGDDLFEWKSNNAYSGNLTADERQAHRISDRIYSTLSLFSFPQCVCWDDNDNQEYYICYNGTALVHNYVADAWYTYTNINATCFANLNGELYFGTNDDRIMKFDELAFADDGARQTVEGETVYTKTAIEAYWESGSMSFNAEYNRKYSSAIWVNIKPQTSSYVEITILTDKKTDNVVKHIATGKGGFADWDFNSFNFADFDMPQIKKLRIKAKKFTYYKLVFRSGFFDPEDPDPMIESTATVLSANIRVRETGYAK